MPYVTIDAIDAVLGGTEIQVPDAYVELRDSTSGFNGPGSYHIQLTQGVDPGVGAYA